MFPPKDASSLQCAQIWLKSLANGASSLKVGRQRGQRGRVVTMVPKAGCCSQRYYKCEYYYGEHQVGAVRKRWSREDGGTLVDLWENVL